MNFNNRCFLLFFWWGSWKHFAIEFDLIYIPIIICHIARVEECEAMILVLPHSANPHLCRDKNDLFTTLQVSESNTNLGYDIKPIIGDGYCVIQSFQEMKSFHIWSYSGSYFPTFLHSVWKRETTDQKNSEYEHFECSGNNEKLQFLFKVLH